MDLDFRWDRCDRTAGSRDEPLVVEDDGNVVDVSTVGARILGARLTLYRLSF